MPAATSSSADSAPAGKEEETIIALRRSLGRRFQAAEARALADALAWQGQLVESFRWYRRVLEHSPHDSSTRLALARALSWSPRPQDREQALALFGAYLEYHPRAHAVWLEHVQVLGWTGRLGEAIEALESYLTVSPNDPAARLQLARTLRWTGVLGNKARALGILRELAGRDETVQGVREELTSLAPEFQPLVRTRLGAFEDASRNRIYALHLEHRIFFRPTIAAFWQASTWQMAHLSRGVALSSAANAPTVTRNQSQRVNLGLTAWALPELELSAALGPRFDMRGAVSDGGVRVGGHALATWYGIPKTSVQLRMSMDDAFSELRQPRVHALQLRAATASATVFSELPGIAAQLWARAHYRRLSQPRRARGSLGGNDSRQVDLSLTFPIKALFYLGYSGSWARWRRSVSAYWSPQSYGIHLASLGLRGGGEDNPLGYGARFSLGASSERDDAWGRIRRPAYMIQANISYEFVAWLVAGANIDFGQSTRPDAYLDRSGYWWMSVTTRVEVRL